MVGVQPPLVYDDFFGFNLHSTVLLGYFGFVFFFLVCLFFNMAKEWWCSNHAVSSCMVTSRFLRTFWR